MCSFLREKYFSWGNRFQSEEILHSLSHFVLVGKVTSFNEFLTMFSDFLCSHCPQQQQTNFVFLSWCNGSESKQVFEIRKRTRLKNLSFSFVSNSFTRCLAFFGSFPWIFFPVAKSFDWRMRRTIKKKFLWNTISETKEWRDLEEYLFNSSNFF